MIDVTATQFLRELIQIDSLGWVTNFEGFPTTEKEQKRAWRGRAWDPNVPLPAINGANAFYSVALFPKGTTQRLTTVTHGVHTILLDDIGTKVDAQLCLDTLGDPTFIIETSKGNFQWGYVLDGAANPDDVKPIHEALKRLKLTDEDGLNTIRYGRLPCGINGKEGKDNFPVHLVAWNPDRRYSIAYLQSCLKINADDSYRPADDRLTDEDYLATFANGHDRYDATVKLPARMAYRGMPATMIESFMVALLDQNQSGNYRVLRQQVREKAQSAVRKYAPKLKQTTEPEELKPFPLSLVMPVAAFNAMAIPKREAIIDDLLMTRTLSMIYAARGAGKTMLALSLAVSVARGTGRFLEWNISGGCRVLYVDGEMSAVELQERLIKFCGENMPERLDILSSESFHGTEESPMNLANVVHQQRFLLLLAALKAAERDPKLIIFDNKSALTGGTEENSNTEQEDFLLFLRSLRHQGYAVMLIHHAGKSGDQRGASRNEDFLDLVIKLDVPKPSDENALPIARGASFKMSFTKNRGLRPDPPTLDLELIEDMDSTFTWAMEKPGRKPQWLIVAEYIYDYKPSTQKEIAKALNINAGNLSNVIKYLRGKREMVEPNDLRSTPSGAAYIVEVRSKKEQER